MDIKISTEQTDGKKIENEVDKELEEFESFFQTLGNTGKLLPIERAILKTYLGWRLGVYKRKAKKEDTP